ncbi:MAG: DUF4062 domain-containing protein [Nitrospira sp.]|nr:DUF4062 domain-containing protein [Nitrospira sp.]
MTNPSIAGELTIFLSSTIGDYGFDDLKEERPNFRREVQDVLFKKAECWCSLSEDWMGGYDATVQKCRERVHQSGGFILLMGYWYGSIPPGNDKSITHLEFEWALEKWKGDPYPKLAVLKPKPGKKADDVLKALADPLLPKVQEELELHALRLAKFHAQVDDKHTEWRTIMMFEDVHDLREDALVIVNHWRGYTPLAAAQKKVDMPTAEDEPLLREDQLGKLGRRVQHEAIKKIFSGLAAYPDVPAVAILVNGDKNEGQRAFVAYVQGSLLKNHHPKRKIGRLPPGSNTVQALVAWVAGTLGLENVSGVDTPQALAEHVVGELKHQQLYFVIDRLRADYAGGFPAFQQFIWEPFWTRLKALRGQQQIVNRLVAIVTDYSGDASSWADVAMDAKPGVPLDFSKLIVAPRLVDIDESDLYEWFDEHEVPDSPLGHRKDLAQRALMDEESGEFDGTPLHVFERLKGERLWPEGDYS